MVQTVGRDWTRKVGKSRFWLTAMIVLMSYFFDPFTTRQRRTHMDNLGRVMVE